MPIPQINNCYLLTHTILLLVLLIPFIRIMRTWKKSEIFLKFVVLLGLGVSLYYYWISLTHRPVYKKLDVRRIKAGDNYTFTILGYPFDSYTATFYVKV